MTALGIIGIMIANLILVLCAIDWLTGFGERRDDYRRRLDELKD